MLYSIKSDHYQYELIHPLSYLQLSSKDFDTHSNFDYKQTTLTQENRCGNYPYHIPIGWYHHAFNVKSKYADNDIWLGQENVHGEWPIAFHGTHTPTAIDNTRQSSLSSHSKADTLQNEDVDRTSMLRIGTGIIVATNCNGGADKYTTPLTISNGDSTETFKVVFQCRVKPGSFTTHTGLVDVGVLWQVVDPQAIRPSGLLLKNETTLS